MPAAATRDADITAPGQLVTATPVCQLFPYLTHMKTITTPQPHLSSGSLPDPTSLFHNSCTLQRGDKVPLQALCQQASLHQKQPKQPGPRLPS